MTESFNFPKVSIIIAVRNEEKRIRECLKQMVNQTYSRDKVEVLVIDGMSTDMTRETVKRFEVGDSR